MNTLVRCNNAYETAGSNQARCKPQISASRTADCVGVRLIYRSRGNYFKSLNNAYGGRISVVWLWVSDYCTVWRRYRVRPPARAITSHMAGLSDLHLPVLGWRSPSSQPRCPPPPCPARRAAAPGSGWWTPPLGPSLPGRGSPAGATSIASWLAEHYWGPAEWRHASITRWRRAAARKLYSWLSASLRQPWPIK